MTHFRIMNWTAMQHHSLKPCQKRHTWLQKGQQIGTCSSYLNALLKFYASFLPRKHSGLTRLEWLLVLLFYCPRLPSLPASQAFIFTYYVKWQLTMTYFIMQNKIETMTQIRIPNKNRASNTNWEFYLFRTKLKQHSNHR